MARHRERRCCLGCWVPWPILFREFRTSCHKEQPSVWWKLTEGIISSWHWPIPPRKDKRSQYASTIRYTPPFPSISILFWITWPLSSFGGKSSNTYWFSSVFVNHLRSWSRLNLSIFAIIKHLVDSRFLPSLFSNHLWWKSASGSGWPRILP